MPYSVDIGDGADALGQNQLTDALDGTYWVSGWDATLGTGDLEVDIAAGDGAVDGADVSTASTQTIDFTGDPDGTDPRKAVIYVDSGGTVQKSLGTPQPVDPSGEIRFRTWNPSPPASVSGVVVAEVWLAAGETVLETADVRDRRVANQAATSATPNTPGWEEDANSPLTLSNQSSGTITLDGEYDRIYVEFTLSDAAGSSSGIGVRVNGDSGANYNDVEVDTDNTTGNTEWGLGPISANGGMEGDFKISGRPAGDVTITAEVAAEGFLPNSLQVGANSSVASPVTSITLLSAQSNNLDATARVYGITL